MIHFDFDWSQPLNQVLAGALVLLLGWQVWGLTRRPQPGVRGAIRVVLNGLLWLILAGYVLQPVWPTTTSATHALLVSDDVSADRARAVQASLGAVKRFTPRTFTGDFAQVTLLGQTFAPELLSRLSRSAVNWIPDQQPDQLETVHWKAIARQGESQHVTGLVQSSRPQLLKLSYAGQTLDSTKLAAGRQTFALNCPVFVRGRTQLELTLNGQPLDTLRFFARSAEPMAYRFLLDNPDFETKTLADWLGRTGQAVQLTSTVSTNIRSSLTINQRKERAPDVIITDPGNAANPLVKRAVLDGKRVLFINLTNPEQDVRTINQALGSRFSVRKTASVESVSLANGMTALPFAFGPAGNQQLVPAYPVAVQRTGGLVGVSLLNETFPLALSGDSVAYARLWYALLAPFQTPGRNNVQVDAPLFSGLPGAIRVNNSFISTSLIRVAGDTARLRPSPINPRAWEGSYRFGRVGWVPVADSLSVFVEPLQASLAGRNRLVGAYRLAHDLIVAQPPADRKPTESRVTEWVWFVLFIGCFTALWVEPKLG